MKEIAAVDLPVYLPGRIAEEKGGWGLCEGRDNRKGVVAERRDTYGDPEMAAWNRRVW